MPKKTAEKQKKSKTLISDEFYSDLTPSETQHAILIRAPKTSGLIAGIETPENFPEGYSIFTAKDIPGKNYVSINNRTLPIFCEKRVQYAGEAVAILVGPNENVLNSLKDKIHVILHDVNEDEEPEEKSIKKELKTGKASESDEEFYKIFESAHKVINSTWNSNFNVPSFTETEGCVCQIKNGNVKIFTPTKWISNLKNVVTEVLGIESENISITKIINY